MDYYTFTLPADALVLAVMTSSEVDGYLTLYDANGNQVRNDDNTYGANDPLIVQYLPAGTYKLAARGASSTVGGLYEVDLRTVTGPRPPFCTAEIDVDAGSNGHGSDHLYRMPVHRQYFRRSLPVEPGGGQLPSTCASIPATSTLTWCCSIPKAR